MRKICVIVSTCMLFCMLTLSCSDNKHEKNDKILENGWEVNPDTATVSGIVIE